MKALLKYKLSAALVMSLIFCQSKAQEDLTKYFPAGMTDAEILIDNYISPFAKAIGAGMNNGWYTTGKVHKKFGFDLVVTANIIFIPSDEEFYDLPSGLGVTPVDGNTSIPTIYGPEGDIRQFEIISGPNTGSFFDAPDGIEIGANVPLFDAAAFPTLQLGVGLVKNTDLRLRYTPKIEIDGTKSSNIGAGLMHDIKQHIPGLKSVPMDLSLFLGYTRASGEIDLSAQFGGSGQVGDVSGSGFTIQALVGKTLSFVSVYGGFGYNTYSLDYDILGTYQVGVIDPTKESLVALPSPLTYTDPFNYSYSGNGVRATIGARLKGGPVIINADYTVHGVNNIFTLGFGFTFETQKF